MFKDTKEVIMFKGPNGCIIVPTVFPEAQTASVFASYTCIISASYFCTTKPRKRLIYFKSER